MVFTFLQKTPYIAIIGDIKDSKKLENRNMIQNQLKQVFEMINETYCADISSKFLITLGDEFQGLLHNGANALTIIHEIEGKMFPVKIRFGIGVGEITTDIDKDTPLGADGPAYYNARIAIEGLKADEKKNMSISSDIRIEIDKENYDSARFMNTIFSLLTAIKNSWTVRQREIIFDMMKHQDSQVEAAKRFNIRQSSIHKNLTKGNYYTFCDALHTIDLALGEIRREQGGLNV